MEGCIHPDCGCSAYEDSKRSKGWVTCTSKQYEPTYALIVNIYNIEYVEVLYFLKERTINTHTRTQYSIAASTRLPNMWTPVFGTQTANRCRLLHHK